MIEVAQVSIEKNLSEFSRWLSLHGILHRIAEVDGQQVLYLPDTTHAEKVREALDTYIAEGDYRAHVNQQLAGVRFVPRKSFSVYPRAMPAQAPFIYLVIALAILVAYVTGLGNGGEVLRALLIVNPFLLDGAAMTTAAERLSALGGMLSLGQIWRLISPDFLHFSLLHIVFNVLMLWILGGQLEIKKGSLACLSLFIFVSVVSNVAQLLDGGYLFGGLSGVVYGLVGYCWVWRRVSPDIFMPEALFRFSIAWLLIGYTPLTEWLGLGRMANSAHLYGLLAGLLWGWWTTVVKAKKIPSA